MSQSVCGLLVKTVIILEAHGTFGTIVHTYACQTFLITDMRNSILMDEALLSISPADHGQLVKIHITLRRHGIFESNCILIYFKIV